MDKKIKQLKKSVDEKQKKLYSTRKDIENKLVEEHKAKKHLLNENHTLKNLLALKNLHNLFKNRKKEAFSIFKTFISINQLHFTYENRLADQVFTDRQRTLLTAAIKTTFKCQQFHKFQAFVKWKTYAFDDYEFTAQSFYNSQLMSTAPQEINLVKVKDSKDELIQKHRNKLIRSQQKEQKLKRIQGVCFDMLQDAIRRNQYN